MVSRLFRSLIARLTGQLRHSANICNIGLMIVIAGSVRVKEGALDRMISDASAMAVASRAEDGCVDYRFSVDLEDPNVVRLFECWRDQKVLEEHFSTPHFAHFSTAIEGAIEDRADLVRYEVSSSGPLFG